MSRILAPKPLLPFQNSGQLPFVKFTRSNAWHHLEDDFTFPLPARRRAEDILVERKRTYHIQVFSGVKHGFAVRCDPNVENESAFILQFPPIISIFKPTTPRAFRFYFPHRCFILSVFCIVRDALVSTLGRGIHVCTDLNRRPRPEISMGGDITWYVSIGAGEYPAYREVRSHPISPLNLLLLSYKHECWKVPSERSVIYYF